MLDSIFLRQQRVFEDDLWFHFQRVCQSSGMGDENVGWLALGDLGMFFGDPVVMSLLMREIPQSAGVEEAAVCNRLQSSIKQYCSDRGTSQLEFHALASLLLRLVRSYTEPKDLATFVDLEFDTLDTESTVL